MIIYNRNCKECGKLFKPIRQSHWLCSLSCSGKRGGRKTGEYYKTPEGRELRRKIFYESYQKLTPEAKQLSNDRKSASMLALYAKMSTEERKQKYGHGKSVNPEQYMKNFKNGGYNSYMKGFFKPRNPSKYQGNPKNIIYRSSYEFKYMNQLDTDPNVLFWSSEETRVPYHSPLDDRLHTYFPDFKVTLKEPNITILVEIKPYTQTIQPTQNGNKKRFIKESVTYAKNQAKWIAASRLCEKRGWKFQILTEKELGIPTWLKV